MLQWSKYIKTQQWNFIDNISIGSIGHMDRLLASILPNFKPEPNSKGLSPGYHFLFNNQLNQNLGKDGYDNYQAPVDLSTGNLLFARRMWVKGRLEFLNPIPINQIIGCQETVTLNKLIGDQSFVNIQRLFEDSLKETRMLMYTNNPYVDNQSPQPSKDLPLNKQIISVNQSQVLKFSCLSYNLHKIHLDKPYCQLEGLQTIILQGPFIISIGLAWFRQLFPELTITSFAYKNVNPLYIDESMELQIYKTTNSNYTLRIMNGISNLAFTGEIIAS